MRRPLTRLLLAALLLAPAAPSGAAGTGGIEISPYPGVVDGKQVTAFHVGVPADGDERQVRYSLRNTTNQRRSARLYAASAARAGDGFTIGQAGSSPYVEFPTREVTLAPAESRIETFTVRGRVTGEELAALVVEVRNGSVTSRAATVVYLGRDEAGGALPRGLTLLAAALLVSVGAAVLRTRRRAR